MSVNTEKKTAERKEISRKDRILISVYDSSIWISLTAMSLVAVLEIFMLIYTLVDPALFGQYMANYRMFYISLLSVAIIYLALYLFVKKDIGNRYMYLNIANPICAVFFFAWSFGITYFDALKYNTVDSMVFMTFSLVVPLIFYIAPVVYGVIVIIADAAMLYLTVSVTGSAASIINLSIFFIFQLVLGVCFLTLKTRLSERIVQEEDNARIDILTGLPNRRQYEEELERLGEEGMGDEFNYISIDLNGLKEINDTHGHDAGDTILIGASECIKESFGDKAKCYRVGGDEFAVLIDDIEEHIREMIDTYHHNMSKWTQMNGMKLSSSYGWVRHSEYPDDTLSMLARTADKKMYEAKKAYYNNSENDRREGR